MRKSVKFLLWFGGFIVVAMIVGYAMGLRFWTVPDDPYLGASMEPTLSAGDMVIVLKSGERSASDLVRCRDPEDAQRWVVGRIYGQANDKVKIEGGFATVNGKRYRTNEACAESQVDTIDPSTGVAKKLSCSRIEFAGGWHMVAIGEGLDTSPSEHTVGAGRYYLVSDNRVYHDDSRDFGAVQAETCDGKLLFRLWGKEGFVGSRRRFTYVR